MDSGKLLKFKEAVLIILIVLDIVLLTYLSIYKASPPIVTAVNQFDLVLCLILFTEFMFNLRGSEDRLGFIRRTGSISSHSSPSTSSGPSGF